MSESVGWSPGMSLATLEKLAILQAYKFMEKIKQPPLDPSALPSVPLTPDSKNTLRSPRRRKKT